MNALRTAALLALAFLSGAVAAQTVPVLLGSTRLEVPAPGNAVAINTNARDLWQFAEDSTPASNRPLAFFVSHGDAAATAGAARLDRYFLVQAERSMEPLTLSPAEFAQIKSATRSRGQVYRETGSSITYVTTSRVRYGEGIAAQERNLTLATSLVFVQGKVLILHAYAARSRDADWARRASASWARDVLGANR